MAAGTAAEQRRGRLRRVDRRACASPRDGPSPASTTALVGRPRCSGRWDRPPSSTYRPAHPDQRAPGAAGAASARCPAARWWSTSARSTPGGRRRVPPRGRRARRPHARGLHARSRRAGVHHPQHPGDRSVLLLHPAGRRPDVRALRLPRVPLPPDRRSRRGARPQTRSPSWPVTQPCPRRRRRRSPRPDARRGVGAVRPLGALLLPGAVRRHAHPGEGPVPVGRGQRVRDGHADLRRTEPELAGAAGHGPGPGSLLAHRPGQRGLPQRRRARTIPPSPPATPSGSGATTCPPATGHRAGPLPAAPSWRRLVVVGPPARHRADLRAGDTTTATQSTGTTSPSPPTRRATCWPSTPSPGWPSWRPWRRPGRRRARQGTGHRSWPPPSTRTCAGPTGSMSTASTPTARRAPHARSRPTRSPSPTAWSRRPTSRWSARTWRLGIDVGPEPRARVAAGSGGGGHARRLVRLLTDASFPGWAHIIAAGGTFTWETGSERSDRGLHVARMGLLGPGRHAGIPARRLLHGSRPRRHRARDGCAPVLGACHEPRARSQLWRAR